MNQVLIKLFLTPKGGFVLGLSLLFALIAAAALGYRIIEGWPLVDGLYMAIITISTVGFKEVEPLSPTGRLFTGFVIIAGLGIVAYSTTKLGQSVLEGELFGGLARMRMQRALDKLSGHFIVCGFGRMGKRVAEGLRKAGVGVCIVDLRNSVEEELASAGFLYLIGDATEEDTLKLAGVERARGLMALLPSDADNVYLTLTAKGINRDVQVISRASDSKAESKLRRSGVDKVVSPYEIAGSRVLEAALRPTVVEFMELATHREHLALGWEEIPVARGSVLDGHSLAESEVRKRYGIIVVAIKRADGQMLFNPDASEKVRGGDILVAMGPQQALTGLESACEEA